MAGCSAPEKHVSEKMEGEVLEHKACTYILDELQGQGLILSYKPSPGRTFDYEAQAPDGGMVYLRHYPTAFGENKLPELSGSAFFIAGNLLMAVRNAQDKDAYREAFFKLCEGYSDHLRKAEKVRREEEEAQGQALSRETAWDAFMEYASEECPQDIKLDRASGILRDETEGAGKRAISCEAVVTNEYGAVYNAAVSCTVEGTDENAVVRDFTIEPN